MQPPILEIYCDFDGTITDCCSFDYLLEKLGHPDWREIEEKWEREEITARECMATQVPLLGHAWPEIVETLKGVNFDPTFAPFVAWCKAAGIKIGVVSDGLDRVIEYLLDREGVEVDFVYANHLVEQGPTKFALEFPYSEDGCLMGMCKCKVLERAGTKVTRVVIGDSQSDFCWARGADLLFAKKKLLDYCRKEGIEHVAYENFESIAKVLESKTNLPCCVVS
jgi:2-hydroxy-3-keto-5-methylthiopentenyl-1-phosphate phosphatase